MVRYENFVNFESNILLFFFVGLSKTWANVGHCNTCVRFRLLFFTRISSTNTHMCCEILHKTNKINRLSTKTSYEFQWSATFIPNTLQQYKQQQQKQNHKTVLTRTLPLAACGRFWLDDRISFFFWPLSDEELILFFSLFVFGCCDGKMRRKRVRRERQKEKTKRNNQSTRTHLNAAFRPKYLFTIFVFVKCLFMSIFIHVYAPHNHHSRVTRSVLRFGCA